MTAVVAVAVVDAASVIPVVTAGAFACDRASGRTRLCSNEAGAERREQREREREFECPHGRQRSPPAWCDATARVCAAGTPEIEFSPCRVNVPTRAVSE